MTGSESDGSAAEQLVQNAQVPLREGEAEEGGGPKPHAMVSCGVEGFLIRVCWCWQGINRFPVRKSYVAVRA
jgi:hypothetical protein